MIKLFVILYVLLCLGCASSKVHNRFIMDKEPFFSKSLSADVPISTRGVYIHYINDTFKAPYQVLRFYENGKCFVSDVINTNTWPVIVDSLPGALSYFAIKDNKLLYEEWTGKYSGYVYVSCSYSKSELVIESVLSRGSNRIIQKLPRPIRFIFLPDSSIKY